MRAPVRWLLVVLGAMLALAPPALADGPGVGTPTVVTLGDSAISGEAGRWAGNTNQQPSRVDALGSTAYWDTATGESIRGCHRSKAAQAHIGGGVASFNFACSGARTSTTGTGSGQDFKPGIDFYEDAQGRKGQAAALRDYADDHNVKAVVGDDRGQQLRLRRDRRALRDQLGDLALVVEELLQRRLGHDVALHRHAPAAGDHQRAQRAVARARRDVAGGLLPDAVHHPRPDLLDADPAQHRLPLRRDGLDAPVDRRLRRLEPRRELGARHGRGGHERQRAQRRRRSPGSPTSRRSTSRTRSTAAVCARAGSACSRRSTSPTGSRRAPWTGRSGSPRSAPSPRSPVPTSSRRAATRATGARRRCATACASPTTAGPCCGGRCVRAANGLNAQGEPQMGLV